MKSKFLTLLKAQAGDTGSIAEVEAGATELLIDLLGGAGSASLGKKAATVSRELISLGDDLAEAAGQGITRGARDAVDELVPEFDLRHGTKSAGDPGGKTVVGSTGRSGPQPTQLAVSPQIVDDYAARLMRGERLRPIEVVELPDGRRFILDGHHRYVASQETGIPVDVNVTKGEGPVGFDWEEVAFESFSPDPE
ncbi:MAG: ParB N-terminal domain-containing protein [bacterium]|nr:ParB N-terminal domain-containing protein [bacterium]